MALRCVFGSWGDAPRRLIYALELTFGTGASTATRTPGGHAGSAASGRPRPEGLRCSGGVTVPARTKAGGTTTLILAAGGALARIGAAEAIFVVLPVGAGVMVNSSRLLN